MSNYINAAVGLLCIALVNGLALPNTGRPIVEVESGLLAGIVTSDSSIKTPVKKFLGVPFARPPIRWTLPEKADPWYGIRDASRFGNACHQQFSFPGGDEELLKKYFNNPPATVPDSEDCLYLNVFVPDSAHPASEPSPESGKPVMFWLHGGSDNSGTAALPAYDGTSLAGNEDVIVVTTNFRLNLFGFPGSPDISKKEQNFGLHDQRLALDWVQRNIHAFGGDPSRVTIFGESSGARSVDNLITAPPDPIPFSAAILQSTVPEASFPTADKADSWHALVAKAGCDTSEDELDCMRRVPALVLKKLASDNEIVFTVYPDGGVTFADNMRATRLSSGLNQQAIARVPIMIGTNADEASAFLSGNTTIDTLLPAVLGSKTAARFLKAYRPLYTGYPSPKARDTALLTDFIYTCPSALIASDSDFVKIPAWRYFYNASYPNTELFPGSGAYHSAEIKPIFGTEPKNGATPFQIETSHVMQTAWADFAKNPDQGPGWDKTNMVQILGGGAVPGESDAGRSPSMTVPSKTVDTHCPAYKPIYDALALVAVLRDAIELVIGPG